MSFDADTALEAIAPGRWRAHFHERWSVARGPNGGFVGALAARAAEAAAERPLRSLTTQFLEAMGPGPVDVIAVVERAGRSTSAVTVRIERDGRPTALALATLGAWRDGEAEWHDAQMPKATPPDEAFRVDPSRNGVSAFVAQLRHALGNRRSAADRPERGPRRRLGPYRAAARRRRAAHRRVLGLLVPVRLLATRRNRAGADARPHRPCAGAAPARRE